MNPASLELLEKQLPPAQARAILMAMDVELASRDAALATKRDLQEGLREVEHRLELKIETLRGDLIRWSFAFWVAQLAAVAGLLKLVR